MVNAICEILICHSNPYNLTIINIFINTQYIFIGLMCLLQLLFMRNMIKLFWLQLHPKLTASDYITTGWLLGRTKTVHTCVTPQGAWDRGSETWLPNPRSLIYFNAKGFQVGPADMFYSCWSIDTSLSPEKTLHENPSSMSSISN